MPLLNAYPWRAQFYDGLTCPDNVAIPIHDNDAWRLNPNHNWVYDKLTVALSQGLSAAPHGLIPAKFPVFSKPLTNLSNMGAGSMVIKDLETYKAVMQPGHFWCTLLRGKHVSSDAVVIDGRVVWWRHTIGKPGVGGTFDYWHVRVKGLPKVENWCGSWCTNHLKGYTGMLNFETIGSRIIEVHLRFSDQWTDLYGVGWMQAVINLYVTGKWEFDDSARKDGYSVVLFGAHGPSYRHPSSEVLAEAKSLPGVCSIQIPFYENRKMEHHSMPPGGFRLAIVNATSLKAGLRAREILASASWE